MSNDKKTLVIGASTNPSRYSYLAINKLRDHDIPVEAVGLREGKVKDVNIQTGQPPLNDIHTVTLYLSEQNQKAYEQYILDLQPKRIIFNPGAENYSLASAAEKAGIEVLDACTLVMLSTRQF